MLLTGGVRLAGVHVADGGGKEFDEAPGGLFAGALDQDRQAARQGDDSGSWVPMSVAI
jgi:hypothetical protein